MSLQLHCSNNECVWFGAGKDLQVNNSVTMYCVIFAQVSFCSQNTISLKNRT